MAGWVAGLQPYETLAMASYLVQGVSQYDGVENLLVVFFFFWYCSVKRDNALSLTLTTQWKADTAFASQCGVQLLKVS